MRFSYAEAMTDPTYYVSLAEATENAGYDAMVIPDSICYPEHSDSRYPFNPDGSREFLEDKPFIEPFSLIPALALVTERIRFVTFVLKLPIRHPVLVAKQATSVGVMTGNRLALGVGSSPWAEDYEVTGVPWEHRGKRMDESLAIIKGLSSGEYFSYQGSVYQIPSIKMAPVPDVPVPLLIGGHGEAALRRAARMGDGWVHGGGDPAELPGLLARLGTHLEQEGRSGDDFEIHVISTDAYTVDGVRRLEDQGVTDVIVGFRWPYHEGRDMQPLTEKLDALRRFSDEVIAKV